jgi:hypothetical protein
MILANYHGESRSTAFKFLNTGKDPLIIYDVKTSCGCTVPEWPKEIIKPNSTQVIKVIFDPDKLGCFNKTVTVFYNGENSPKTLRIKGYVVFYELGGVANKE